MSGLTYAIFNIYHAPSTGNAQMNWPSTIYAIIREQAPSSFIYLLFGVSWYWASKHYRSHWHNFVINAYRHRALYRFERLQYYIQKRMELKDYNSMVKAEETILELFRLSGFCCLFRATLHTWIKLEAKRFLKQYYNGRNCNSVYWPKSTESTRLNHRRGCRIDASHRSFCLMLPV